MQLAFPHEPARAHEERRGDSDGAEDPEHGAHPEFGHAPPGILDIAHTCASSFEELYAENGGRRADWKEYEDEDRDAPDGAAIMLHYCANPVSLPAVPHGLYVVSLKWKLSAPLKFITRTGIVLT